MMAKLFTSRKQKTVWIIYVLLLVGAVTNWQAAQSSTACLIWRSCISFYPTLITLTITAIIVAYALGGKRPE